jgi:D-xylose transport system substrate-binding protein
MFVGKKTALAAALFSVSLVIASCGSSTPAASSSESTSSSSESSSESSAPMSSSGSESSSPESSSSESSSAAGGELGATSITADFAAMAALQPIAAAGHGKITAILPDTTTSARYTEFDAPYLEKAFTAAGLTKDDFSVVNAQGSTATQLTDAQTAISAGATVLIVDPLDSGTGAQIESYAKSHGVPVIDYDRLTLSGSRDYFVSFDNVKVGTLIGQGFVQCATDWGLSDVKFIEMAGAPTDNNATLFKQGYDAVLKPLEDKGTYQKVAEPAGTWDPPTAATEFQQAMTANPGVNAALTPNDGNTAPIITYLKTQNVKPKTFPLTGQDATLDGLQNILAGYQCGTVYKPIYLEAQAAAALAIFLRAGQTPPTALVNGTAKDTQANTDVPAVLMPPVWVTAANMNDTVVKDKAVTAAQLCQGYTEQCTAAGISG